MSRKSKTSEEFIEKAKQIHGGRYDYSLVEYKRTNIKVKIICPIHGVFEQNWISHINMKAGCPRCSGFGFSLDEKIIQANDIHNSKYDYSLINENFKKNKNISIICSEHGLFVTTWDRHINSKQGCPKCAGVGLSRDEKIFKANKIHNNKYDYSLIIENFKVTDKVPIMCSKHGVFYQTWNSHTESKKQGCPRCKKKKMPLEDKINLANKIHNNKYNYSLLPKEFKSNSYVNIICPIHGEFKQNWVRHTRANQGCPMCSKSKGEEIIRRFLLNNNIEFIPQHMFEGCKNKRKLPFDFYLPDYNTCIEYDGIQHVKAVKCFGGEEEFKNTKYKDNIKTQYCLNNNINLIRISYIEFDDIEYIINENLFNNLRL